MVISIGAAAFWIALAAVLIASSYFKFRRERDKQHTLLRMIEKTGQLDEQQVRLMFPQPPPMSATHERPWWAAQPDPLAGQRAMRCGGLILVALGVGLAVLSTALRFGPPWMQQDAMGWLGAGGLAACLGAGLVVASWFATGPVHRDGHD